MMRNVGNILFGLTLVAIAVTTSACGSHDLCKTATPPPGTVMPAGQTCATLCNRSQCPTCCGHTTTPGSRADDACRDGCAGSAMITPPGGGSELASIVPAGTMSIINASPAATDFQSMAQLINPTQTYTLIAAINCQTNSSWNSINQTLSSSLPSLYSTMQSSGVNMNSAGDRAGFLYSAVMQSLTSAPGRSC